MNPFVQTYLKFARQGPQTLLGWLLLVVLTPFSVLYGLIGLLRIRCYRSGLLVSYSPPIPVVSVGNLASGGKGKTPLVDYLAKYFSTRGLKVAIVSRGYGGSARDRVSVVKQCAEAGQAASICGDEPLLLQRRNPQIEVLTAKRRAEGIRYATEQLSADVVLLDDGFQHLAVARRLDIVMLDAQLPFGNGWPLPAGELREFARAYRRADLLVLSRCSDNDRLPPYFSGPVVRTRHRLEPYALDLAGQRVPIVELAGQKGVAFAGIASPDAFFTDLEKLGVTLTAKLSLSDHAVYDQPLLKRLKSQAKGADFLVTTEKDGVKLAAGMFEQPCYQIPLQLEILSGSELLHQVLDQYVSQGVDMNLTEDLLAILACPKCKGPVSINETRTGLVCPTCKLVYPVRDDIPVMLIDEAIPI